MPKERPSFEPRTIVAPPGPLGFVVGDRWGKIVVLRIHDVSSLAAKVEAGDCIDTVNGEGFEKAESLIEYLASTAEHPRVITILKPIKPASGPASQLCSVLGALPGCGGKDDSGIPEPLWFEARPRKDKAVEAPADTWQKQRARQWASQQIKAQEAQLTA